MLVKYATLWLFTLALSPCNLYVLFTSHFRLIYSRLNRRHRIFFTAFTMLCSTHVCVYVVVVVVVFTLKTVLTSIQYPSLSYSSRQRNEFPWSHANPK